MGKCLNVLATTNISCFWGTVVGYACFSGVVVFHSYILDNFYLRCLNTLTS